MFFDLDKDATSIRRIVGMLTREPIEGTMRRAADASLRHFNLDQLPQVYTLRLPCGVLSPRIVFDLYINGEIFHGSPEKRDRWRNLTNSRSEPVLYSMLLQAAAFKAQAVIEVLSTPPRSRPCGSGAGDFATEECG